MRKKALSQSIKTILLTVSLSCVLAACQGSGGGNSGSNPIPPPPPPPDDSKVSAVVHQITPAITAITITTSGASSVVAVTTPGAEFDTYLGGNTPAWCAGSTCSTPCPETNFDMTPGTSCNLYVHAKNNLAVGAVPVTDSLTVFGNGIKVASYTLKNTGVLYAGGAFETVDGLPVNRIAKWDGSAWSPLSSGMNDVVNVLKVTPNGTLLAGGAFTSAGSTTINYLASWNGSAWQGYNLPEQGVLGPVTTLAVRPDGSFYAAGYTSSAAEGSHQVQEWDGSSWHPLTDPNANTHGMSGQFGDTSTSISSLLLDQTGTGNLYAGGYFTGSDGKMTYGIALWNGQTWNAVTENPFVPDQPFDNGVDSLIQNAHGDIYAGGSFQHADGQDANHLAVWNGQWNPVSDPNQAIHGFNDAVTAMAYDANGNLYAGGPFNTVDTTLAHSIAMWNGSTWRAVTNPSAIDHGLSASLWMPMVIGALAYDPNSHDLYVGGNFTKADDTSTPCLAMWNGTNWFAVTNNTLNNHGFGDYVSALAIGNELSIKESNS